MPKEPAAKEESIVISAEMTEPDNVATTVVPPSSIVGKVNKSSLDSIWMRATEPSPMVEPSGEDRLTRSNTGKVRSTKTEVSSVVEVTGTPMLPAESR